METVELDVEIREKTGKGEAGRIRRNKKIPAVVYGGKENLHIVVSPEKLKDALRGPFRLNTLLKLKVKDHPEIGEKIVMLKDYQIDPISDKLIHADFIEVREDRKLIIEVPVRLQGTPEGVKKGGVLQWNIRKLKLRCYLKAIIPEVVIDISPLSLGHSFHIGDLKLPEGVEVLMDKTLPIVTITEIVEEKPPAEAVEEVPKEEKAEEKEEEKKGEKEEEKEEEGKEK
jgi:large subunit ribosomal protein L25